MAAPLPLQLAAVVATALLGLTACGSETAEPAGGDAAATPAETTPAPASDLPACETVWVAGQDLPGGYDGCVDGGVEVPAERQECSIGRPLITFGEEFYAVPGRVVNQVEDGLEASDAYRSAQAACSG